MEILYPIMAGLIALAALPTRFKLVAAVLFAEFLIMFGYDELQIAIQDQFYIFKTTESFAWFYSIKGMIQAIFLMLYITLNSRGLCAISAVIMAYLFFMTGMSLSGIWIGSYEAIMTVLSIIQLLIGIHGVYNGYRSNPDYIGRGHRSGHHRGA